MSMKNYRLKNSQSGFSLIEALVAFLILSVGMLGIASLQTVSLRAGHTASLRSVAVIKSGEIMERIRANPTQVLSYVSSAGVAGTNNGCNDLAGAVKRCTPAEMAADDIYNWKADLKSALPDNSDTTASIAVTVPGAGEALTAVTVTINWKERLPGSKALQDQSYSVSSTVCGSLQC